MNDLFHTPEEFQFAFSKMSHEIRNPVAYIYSSMQLLEKEMPALSNSRRWDDIKEEMQELIQLLQKLSAFNHCRQINRKPLNLTDFFHSIDSHVQTTLPPNCHFYLEIPDCLPVILADSIQLKEVFVNLIRNGFESMPNGGSIHMLIQSQEDTIHILLKDQGDGIPADVQAHIFEPFYSTKTGGTGLGLAIAKSIVSLHNGSIECQSASGEGTTFVLTLPVRTIND